MSDNERLGKPEKSMLDMLLVIGGIDARLDGLEAVLEGMARVLEKEAAAMQSLSDLLEGRR